MKLVAIDIGSNAIRFQLVKVFEEENSVSFKKLEYLRFPLRLGHDVFKKGKITSSTQAKFEKLMRIFKLLIDLYEVDAYRAVATSAMREAENGPTIQKYIRDMVGLKIDIIEGSTEAHILNKSIIPFLREKQYVHIDVGGGSTELNILEGKELIKSQSFKIGSVRKLSANKRAETFKDMHQWLQSIELSTTKTITGIGTGGNINKLYKLSKKPFGSYISLSELKALRAYAKAFTYEERISVLKMNPDRADVIIPASEIYINVLQFVGSDQIMVPKVGLKDGLIYELYETVSGKNLAQIELLEEF